jgi:hypothetical protein
LAAFSSSFIDLSIIPPDFTSVVLVESA